MWELGWLGPLVPLTNRIFAWWYGRRHLRLATHEAFFLNDHKQEAKLFITTTNLSRDRDLVVTHLWVETRPATHVLDPEMPKRLEPDESWETAIAMPPKLGKKVFTLARARLSSGHIVRSIKDNVPPVGNVPRG